MAIEFPTDYRPQLPPKVYDILEHAYWAMDDAANADFQDERMTEPQSAAVRVALGEVAKILEEYSG